ncbi:MAG TPA: hypothetical protein VK602_06755, partial [Phyllobacterium sp.]|nr:hypothetical protein [Phyllobacterium sp.]
RGSPGPIAWTIKVSARYFLIEAGAISRRSGAAVELRMRPALNSQVILGSMRGRVVRHFEEGVAIEFATVQSREAIDIAFEG